MNAPVHVFRRAVRILIVDDQRDYREVLEIVLEHEGFVTQTATGGAEALAMVAIALPDLVLLDIMMPGMDGYEVAATLRATIASRDVPIIMVSAFHGRDARARALRAGADDFVAKPVERVDLCTRIRNLLPAGSCS